MHKETKQNQIGKAKLSLALGGNVPKMFPWDSRSAYMFVYQ